MSDARRRQLEREVARYGDPVDASRLARELERVAPILRDPRRDPVVGDVVEVPAGRFSSGGLHRRLVLDREDDYVRVAWQIEPVDRQGNWRVGSWRFRGGWTSELGPWSYVPPVLTAPDPQQVTSLLERAGTWVHGVAWAAGFPISLSSWRSWARRGTVVLRGPDSRTIGEVTRALRDVHVIPG